MVKEMEDIYLWEAQQLSDTQLIEEFNDYKKGIETLQKQIIGKKRSQSTPKELINYRHVLIQKLKAHAQELDNRNIKRER